MERKKRNLENFIRVAFVAALITALSFSGLQVEAATKMPNFTLPSIENGEIVDARKLEGNVLLINFFATWCGPCRREIPELVKLQEKHADDHFSVVGISVDRGKKSVAKFAKKMKINYPVAMGDDKVLDDFGGVDGIPVSFLVDRTGYVVKSYTGYIDPEIFCNDVARMLK